MKRGLIFMAITAFIGLSSCDKVAELVDFGIPMSKEQAFVIDITATDANTFDKVMDIDESGNQEVKDNIENISEFDIKKMAYKVTSYTGDPAIVGDGMIQFYNMYGNLGDPVSTGPIEFKTLSDSGAEVEISVSNELRSTLETKLLEDQAFSMRFYGTVSGKPVRADMLMLVELEAKVTF